MIRFLRPTTVVLLAFTGACSSKTTPSSDPVTPVTNGQCATKALSILFTPMFSAYTPGHTFQIPAVVNGIEPGSVPLTFSASDPSMVDIQQPDPNTGIATITTRKAGTVDIVASAGSLCGLSTLTITAATEQDWSTGNTRYNNMVTVMGPGGLRPNRDAGPAEFACTNCHGDTATAGLYKTVSHTPQQTAGFSDADLMNIFQHGMVPKGGYFDDMIVSYDNWQGFHRWGMTDAEAKGLVVYLRALTPASQTGMRGDFGGRRTPPDGGFGGGNRGRREGGAGDPGAGGPGDAAAASD